MKAIALFQSACMVVALAAFSAAAPFALAKDNFCHDIGEMAEIIMTARQSGMTKDRAYVVTETMDPAFKPLARHLIDVAFQRPRMASSQDQQTAVRSFRSDFSSACTISGAGK